MKIIAYDLGTGGVKASLYDDRLQTLAKSFYEYKTYYPEPNHHEQRPEEWWQGVIQSTHRLIEQSGVKADDIKCVALSGQSLVCVPMDTAGNSLLEYVPIWSDSRAADEAREYFEQINESEWYETTGNGFPAGLYSIFKLMWLKKKSPTVFNKIDKVLGSKDYINYRLTGNMFTDNSYASGLGAYNLLTGKIEEKFLAAADLRESIFPEIVPSHTVIGTVTSKAAEETGLPKGTKVVCGGVDNACMALGAVGAGEGKAYISLGSSSWIPVNSAKPVLDFNKKPYVFAHIQEGMYTSAFSIFSGGSSLKWARDTLCSELSGDSAYDEMGIMAAGSPMGSNGIIFNPSLAGGTSQDKSTNIKGAFLGLHLGSTKQDMIRAVMEGIVLNLKQSYDFLCQHVTLSDSIMICGGGSKSKFWLQMFADVFDIDIIKTNVDQDTASLGAAAIAARGVGLWNNYSNFERLHKIEYRCTPNKDNARKYKRYIEIFNYASDMLSDYGDYVG